MLHPLTCTCISSIFQLKLFVEEIVCSFCVVWTEENGEIGYTIDLLAIVYVCMVNRITTLMCC